MEVDSTGIESESNRESTSDISGDEEVAAATSSDEEIVAPPPLAPNRSRRANAGNLMAKLMSGEELERRDDDEVYEKLYGGFLDVRFSSHSIKKPLYPHF